MHEWALAEAVISATIEEARKEDLKRVTEVRICIGELQQIEEEVLLFALAQLKKNPLEKAQFKIEKAKAKMKCRACGNAWVFSRRELDEDTAEAIHFVPEVAHVYIKCPKCGSPDFEVLEGRGIWLQSITGEK